MVILIVSWVMGGYFYANFPVRVASHWNFAGQVDGYSGRMGGAFGLPTLLCVMYILFLILPAIDPKRERYAEFDRYYRFLKTAIMATLLVVYTAMGLFNLGYPIKIGYVVSGSIGLLMTVLGSFMGKIKNNWFVGIRTPWTLSSERVWDKTHRVGGWLFIIYGLIIIVSPYLPAAWGVTIFIAGAVLLVFGTAGYSYWLYRHENVAKYKK